eukprot:30871-Pelagococcus_subviridis.AAC.10
MVASLRLLRRGALPRGRRRAFATETPDVRVVRGRERRHVVQALRQRLVLEVIVLQSIFRGASLPRVVPRGNCTAGPGGETSALSEARSTPAISARSATLTRLVSQKLREDAPDGPVVDGGVVLGRPQQKFRGAVPQRHDPRRVRAVVPGLVIPREPKVAQLQFAAVVQKEVRQLQVAVEDPLRVKKVHRLQELQDEALHLALREAVRLYELRHIVLAVLED